MPPLSWRQHTLIQALLSRGPLKEKDFLSIFLQVTGKSGSQQQLFNDYMRKINEELGYCQLELRAVRNQYTGAVYYGAVNNVSDEQSKLGTKYTVPQIAFYNAIIEAIIHDEEAKGCIFNTYALNIRMDTQVTGAIDSQSQGDQTQVPAAFRNFSMSQKEKTLEQLVKDQWLCSIEDGKIGIGVRSFLDLRSWFRTNEVSACEVCNEAAIKAERCTNENCNVRLHGYCVKKKFSKQRVDRVCPGCGTQWPASKVKTETQEHEEAYDDSGNPSQNPDPPTLSARKKRKTEFEAKSTLRSGAVSKRLTRSSFRANDN